MTTKPESIQNFNALALREGGGVPVFLPTPFRRSLLLAPEPPSPALERLFKGDSGLIYDQAVTSYLQAFTDSGLGMPKVLRELKTVWTRDGFLAIDDLTQALLQKTHPGLPGEAVDILHQQIQNRYRDPEPLTGYDRKQHAPLTIGLGHLYGVLTGRPVALVMMDDMNLGGLMEHVDKLMAVRDGRAPGQTQEGGPAYKLADRILTAMAGTAREAYETGIRDSRRMVSLALHRFGGDEKTALLTGLSQVEVERLNETYVIPAGEALMAQLGLLTNPYLKDRDNPLRAGTGTAMSIVMLDGKTRPGYDLVAAEDGLTRTKREIGMDRQGYLSSDYFNSLGRLVPPAGYARTLREEGVVDYAEPLTVWDQGNLFQLEMAARRYRQAESRHEHLVHLAQQSGAFHERPANPLDHVRAETDGVGNVKWRDDRRHAPYSMSPQEAAHVLDAMEQVLQKPQYARFLNRPENAIRAERSSTRRQFLFATPIELEALRFDHVAETNGLSLRDRQKMLCHTLLGSFSPTDPATGTLMRDVMPELFGRFARDTELLRLHARSNPKLLPRTRPEDLRCFAVSVSLNNLAGVNKLLGNDNANLVLRYFTEHVVQGSYAAHGIGREYLESGHEGGGHLMILNRPVFEKEGRLHCVSLNRIGKIEAEMEKRMKKWRRQNVTQFLHGMGAAIPDGLDPALVFGDIKDPKRSTPGISLATAHLELSTMDSEGRYVTGGRLRSQLAAIRDEKIDLQRGGTRASRQEKSRPRSSSPAVL